MLRESLLANGQWAFAVLSVKTLRAQVIMKVYFQRILGWIVMFSVFKDETRKHFMGPQTPPPAGFRNCGASRKFKRQARSALSDRYCCTKVSIFFCLLAVVLPASVVAGPNIHLGGWVVTPDGTVSESGVEYDLREDLNMREETIGAIELQWLGAFARFQSVEFSGESEISGSSGVLGVPLFTVAEPVGSRVDIDEWSAGWRPIDFFGLKLGAAVKHIEGMLDARVGDAVGAYPVDETFPLVAAEFALPLGIFGLVVGAEGLWVAYDDDTVYEWQMQVGFGGEGPHVSLGYRLQRYDISNGDEALDATLDGAFAQLGWRF